MLMKLMLLLPFIFKKYKINLVVFLVFFYI